jgi:hypothetical protein
MVTLKCFSVVLLIGILSACQVLNAPNVPATLSAQNTAYAAEATTIVLSIRAADSNIVVTAQAAETTIAEYSSINRQLLATVAAIIPPTPARQVGAAPGANVASGDGAGVTGDAGGIASSGAVSSTRASQFVETAITARIRESDGCADGFQTEFVPDVARIYAVTKAISISAGTTVQAEWRVAGEIVSQGSYTTPADQTNFCIWFPLDPESIPLTSGQWSVRLSVNGLPIEPTLFFTIADVMPADS